MLKPRAKDPLPEHSDRPGRHVCVVTTAHPVDDVRVHSKIAASFLARGFRVSWVGPASTYFTSDLAVDDRIDYHLTAANRTRLDRLTSGRRVRAVARGVQQVDWWYSPDPDAAELCVAVAAERGGRVLFDVHEVFHGALLDRYLLGRRAGAVRRYVRRRVARTCRAADLVIGVNRSVLEPYLTDWSSACVVRNCAPTWFSSPADGTAPRSGAVRVMHGKSLPTNGTPVVLDALDALPVSGGLQVVMFAGMQAGQGSYSGDQLGGRLARLEQQGSVELLDGVPHRQVPAILGGCDVGMIAYGRGLGEDSLPNRLFEYMAAGLAVLAPSYAREICEIVDREGIGLTADFDDPQDVARAFSWLADHPGQCREMGRRAREAFLARHSWDAEFDRLLAAMTATDTAPGTAMGTATGTAPGTATGRDTGPDSRTGTGRDTGAAITRPAA